MVLIEQIEEVVDAQLKRLVSKKGVLQREKLEEIELLENFALIVTGIRRCGKSTLLNQLLSQEKKDFLFLNFEDPRLTSFSINDFSRLTQLIGRRSPEVLFFDEIQVVDGWELFVRQMLDDGYYVAITGSNASLLSRELGTKLTGRHLSVELFPFSYREFLAFKKRKPNTNSVEKYIEMGGFPEYLKTNNGQILNHLLDDIIARDIAIRHGIRDFQALRRLAVYLISNIGKPVSANNLKNDFSINATSTMLEYFSHLEDAYIVQFLPKFSYSSRAQIRNPKKVYAIDLGLFSHNSIVFSEEKGRRLENLVYLHLRRTHEELYYFKEKGECDFVVFEKSNVKQLVQVCYELNPDNLEREIKGLMEAIDFFKMKSGVLVTLNQTDEIVEEDKKISVVSANDFLLSD